MAAATLKKSWALVPHTSQGYVLGCVSYSSRGYCYTQKSFNITSPLDTFMLLGKGVLSTTQTTWHVQKFDTDTQAIDESLRGMVSVGDGFTTAQYHRNDIEFTRTAIAKNCSGVVSSDSYLCTIPMALGDPTIESFFCIHRLGEITRIGLVAKKACIAVFTEVTSIADASSYLFRILNYCKRMLPQIEIPKTAYILGCATLANSRFTVVTCSIDTLTGLNDSFESLSACGAALTVFVSNTPLLMPACEESSFRALRVGLLRAAVGIIALAIAAIAVFGVLREVKKKDFAYISALCEQTLHQDTNSVKILDSIKVLTQKIDTASGRIQDRVQWSAILSSFGATRPDGLLYERMGSEPVPHNDLGVRIVLWGNTLNERAVTQAIENLMATGLYSEVTLASLERREAPSTKSNFRIVCTVK